MDLDARRRERGLTLQAMGESFGVTAPTIWRWLRNGVPAERAELMAEMLAVTKTDIRPDLWPAAKPEAA